MEHRVLLIFPCVELKNKITYQFSLSYVWLSTKNVKKKKKKQLFFSHLNSYAKPKACFKRAYFNYVMVAHVAIFVDNPQKKTWVHAIPNQFLGLEWLVQEGLVWNTIGVVSKVHRYKMGIGSLLSNFPMIVHAHGKTLIILLKRIWSSLYIYIYI